MYYKIENKDSEVYKKLYELRKLEKEIDERNKVAIEAKAGLTFDEWLGSNSQQSFRRVHEYVGFNFKEVDQVNPKVWVKHKEHPNCFVPNTRTKLGREMRDLLWNGLEYSCYSDVLEILGLEDNLGRFTFPYVEVVSDDLIILYVGDNQQPQDQENVIEITFKEFDAHIKKFVDSKHN